MSDEFVSAPSFFEREVIDKAIAYKEAETALSERLSTATGTAALIDVSKHRQAELFRVVDALLVERGEK